LVLDGFEIRDVLVDGDSAQHNDRLLVGPQGLFVAGFRTLPGNVWQPGSTDPGGAALLLHAQTTRRLADLVQVSLQPELTRHHIAVMPVLTVIGPEQIPGHLVAGLPLLGPAGLLDHLSAGPHVLTPMQIAGLADRVDDWLALRSISNLRTRGSRQGGNPKSL